MAVLPPFGSPEATGTVEGVGLQDLGQMAAYLAHRGVVDTLLSCMGSALAAGNTQAVEDLWKGVGREARSQEVSTPSTSTETGRPSAAHSTPSSLIKNPLDRKQVVGLVMAAHALQENYRGAIILGVEMNYFNPPTAEKLEQSLRDYGLPDSYPYKDSADFLCLLELAVLVKGGPGHPNWPRFEERLSPDLFWRWYRRLLGGSLGEEPWCSYTRGSRSGPHPPLVFIDDAIWNLFVSYFARNHRLDLAQRVLDDMTDLGLTHPTVVLNKLLDGHGKKGDLEKAKAIWAQISNPDVFAYTSMIAALFQGWQPEEALRLFEEASTKFGRKEDGEDARGGRITVVTYNAAIHGLLINGRVVEAEALCDRMQAEGPRPDTTTYNTFLRHFGRKGNSEAFSRVLRELKADGLKPDIYTFSTILNRFIELGRSDAVQRLLGIMEEMGVKPNTATYTAIIDGRVRMKGNSNLLMGLELLKTMEREQIPANEVTYTCLVTGAVRDRSISPEVSREVLDEVIARMTARGMEPNRVMSNFLIEAHLSRGGVDEAMALWRSTRKRHVPDQTYFVLLSRLMTMREEGYAQEVLDHMRASGFQPRGALSNLSDRHCFMPFQSSMLAPIPILVNLLVLSLVAWSLPTNGIPPQGTSVKFQGTKGPKKLNSYIVTYRHGVDKRTRLNAFKATHPGIKIAHDYDSRMLNGFTLEMNSATAAALSHQSGVDHVLEDAIMTHPIQTEDSQSVLKHSKKKRKGRKKTKHGTLDTAQDTINNVQQAPARWNLYDISHPDAPSLNPTSYNYPHAESAGAGADEKPILVNLNTDMNGHGTHVAGIVGGASYGVAPRANLIAVQVLDAKGSGPVSDIIAGINWVMLAHETKNGGFGSHLTTKVTSIKPSVINLSLKGAANSALDTAVTAAVRAGIHVCAAAGNSDDNADAYSPGRVASILTVGASDIHDQRAYFSSFGTDVDVFAPGMTITSAWIGSQWASNVLSGTSQATPGVSGAVAVILSETSATMSLSPEAVSLKISGMAKRGTDGSSFIKILQVPLAVVGGTQLRLP
ncbi:subtilisin-like serine protease [Tulasnella sp. 332]|nr:subtilisin-like serine protease [Tulasnella sp. 332]